jgi:hypothetical protein
MTLILSALLEILFANFFSFSLFQYTSQLELFLDEQARLSAFDS